VKVVVDEDEGEGVGDDTLPSPDDGGAPRTWEAAAAPSTSTRWSRTSHHQIPPSSISLMSTAATSLGTSRGEEAGLEDMVSEVDTHKTVQDSCQVATTVHPTKISFKNMGLRAIDGQNRPSSASALTTD